MAPAPTAPLPIDEVLPRLTATLEEASSAVLRAPTGAGKTTRVPPALLDDVSLEGAVWMVEPRRIAARAAARRIAGERGWTLGHEVGYRVRFDHRAREDSKLVVMTEGIVLRRLQQDPFLEGVGALVFDEFHERRLDSDLALAMAARVQREVRPDLRLVVMSATLDPAPIAAFLGDCPVIESRGFLHPVTVEYGDEPFHLDPRPWDIASAAARGARRALEDTAGDVLVFLPGVGEIHRVAEHLDDLATVAVVALYGDLPPDRQDTALETGPQRRVVLATNVAETSVTVEGITTVVDSGWMRRMRFDTGSGLDRLELARISRASAEQRAGRAGRLAPGRCLRLWTEHDHRRLTEREAPEIRRIDLAGTVLQLLAWGEPDPLRFAWFEAPGKRAVEQALALLRHLGAVTNSGITALGRRMAALPLHPRLAALVLAGDDLGAGRRAALAAALLSERDPFRRGGSVGRSAAAHESDLLDRIQALEKFEERGYLPGSGGEHGAARHVLRVRDQLAKAVLKGGPGGRRSAPQESSDPAFLRALLAAYPDRLARRREPNEPRAVLVGGTGVTLAPGSGVHRAELFLALDLAGRSGAEAVVRSASEVRFEWLPEAALRAEIETEFDPERQRVVGYRRLRWHDLVLEEREVPVAADVAAEVLAGAAALDLEAALGLDRPAIRTFLARLDSLREGCEIPSLDAAFWQSALPSLTAGKRSYEELRKAPLIDTILGALGWDVGRRLEREAPERIRLPSGRSAPLDWTGDGPPVLAARIQELFGLTETPRVGAGRVPVLLHLLAPNFRPQQITQDLAGFWRRTYPEVRKELQGRYPKHDWPEDPVSASPQKVGRRRR
ncbi:MAG: ATP-dependent helicase HrpB [Acidobacteriota bacterium]